jgi:hypothetical protein
MSASKTKNTDLVFFIFLYLLSFSALIRDGGKPSALKASQCSVRSGNAPYSPVDYPTQAMGLNDQTSNKKAMDE